MRIPRIHHPERLIVGSQIALSDDAELGREERYVQQQRLRTAIAHHGRQQHEEQEARRDQLTRGGEIH